MGKTMYIWGGGWDVDDEQSGAGSTIIGVSPVWEEFAKKQDSNYDYENYRYKRELGLDCSGYVGWVIYNLFETESGKEGYVTFSTEMAENFANRGWGKLYKNKKQFLVGDIVSMDGHIWMYLGSCPDGSGVIIHSSPMGQTYGGGVQLAGTTDAAGNRNSQGYRLADAYMKKYFSDWPYATNVCSVSYRSSAVGYARWKSDPDGIQAMSAEQVLKTILGNV